MPPCSILSRPFPPCVCESLAEQYIYLYAGLCESYCAPLIGTKDSVLMEIKSTALAPDISPSGDTQPFIPLLAPSPLTPFTNNTVPILSGLPYLPFMATAKPYNLIGSIILCDLIFKGYRHKLLCHMKQFCPPRVFKLEP